MYMHDLSEDEYNSVIEWWNRFSLIVNDHENTVYKVFGYFDPNNNRIIIKYYDYWVVNWLNMHKRDYDYWIVNWLNRHKRTLEKIMKSYRVYHNDPYRVYYESPINKVGKWQLVVIGWIGMMSDYNNDEKLKGLIEYENMNWRKKYVTTLFVFPRGSNITVINFDVWTPAPITFRKILKLTPGEYIGRGYAYRVM